MPPLREQVYQTPDDLDCRLVYADYLSDQGDPRGEFIVLQDKEPTGPSLLIMDREPIFTRDFRDLLLFSGVTPVRLPARSPNLNAYAERFVLSIKCECLNRLVLLCEGHLRLAVREYATHYNRERPHQGLDGP